MAADRPIAEMASDPQDSCEYHWRVTRQLCVTRQKQKKNDRHQPTDTACLPACMHVTGMQALVRGRLAGQEAY